MSLNPYSSLTSSRCRLEALLEGEAGMRHWIEMFANDLLSRVAADQREEFLKKVEEELRPVLYRDGTWRADYWRLRVVAHRADP